MATTVVSNLYPPIIDTYMPAFVRTDACKVYFSLSDYNTYEDVKTNVQVTVVHQKSNKSALNSEIYTSLIKVTEMKKDDIDADDKYYIEILPEDLTANQFELNQFYKVQIRFTRSKDNEGNPIPQEDNPNASWFTNNLMYFSEWSTVCLIKGIEQPKIELNIQQNEENILTSPTLNIVGKMIYEINNNIEKEILESYKIQLLDTDNNILEDSGIVLTDAANPNEINYTLKYYLEENVQYKISFIYTTINQYTPNENLEYLLNVQYDTTETNLLLQIQESYNDGFFKITVSSEENFTNPIVIMRTSSDSNFKIWEQIKIFNDIENKKEVFFNDKTIDGGVWYKYYGQYKVNNKLTQPTSMTEPKMILFEDILLTTRDKQLNIKFNPDIGTYRKNILDSKTDTVGGKYPIITRNSNTDYRQFSISGIISSQMDENHLFADINDIYSSDSIELYKAYNLEHKITPMRDFVYERKFRELVMNFLYDSNVKLYRTATEGNILIRITDVSLTPEKVTGRLVFNFSCNATEIADATLKNYDFYNIHCFTDEIKDKDYLSTKEEG